MVCVDGVGAENFQPLRSADGTTLDGGRMFDDIINAVLTLNILTAFIRLGRARPEGAGCPPYS